MKLLWDRKFVRFKDKRPSSRPKRIKNFLGVKSHGQFSNTLLAFVCIESNDNESHIQRAIKEICKVLDMFGRQRSVIIVPFVHLSSNIAPPHKTVSLLRELINRLKNLNVTVNIVSFGYHKEFELHFVGRGHPSSVAFRELE